MKRDCPSSPLALADNVLGVFSRSGTLRYLPFKVLPPEADDDSPAVRYSTGCVGSQCKHWIDSECEWPRIVLSRGMASATTSSSGSANCNIRATCRWRHQATHAVCGPCSTLHGSLGDGLSAEVRVASCRCPV
jgi:hypothetical protein